MMPCSMRYSSRSFSTGWPILSFAGKHKKTKPTVIEDAVSLALDMHSYLNPTAKSPTLPRHLLPIWLLLRRLKVNFHPTRLSPPNENVEQAVDERGESRKEATLVKAITATGHNVRSLTTEWNRASPAVGIRPKKIKTIAEATTSIQANHTISKTS